jgi:CHAT domain-containing protein
MGEIFGLKFNADLVTLSACNTGRGQLITGEGVIGLTRAFMYAGTPAVAMTLWSIESRSSQELTTCWFKRLKAQPHCLAEDLRQTKLELLNLKGTIKNFYRHPYFWSGWVVFGVAEKRPRAQSTTKP